MRLSGTFLTHAVAAPRRAPVCGPGPPVCRGVPLRSIRLRPCILSFALVGVGVLLALSVLVGLPSSAGAASLKAEREKARRLAAEVVRLDERIDAGVIAFSRATVALDAVQTQISRNDRLRARVLLRLKKARSILAACAADLYKREDVTGLDVLFSAADFRDVVDQLALQRCVVRTRSDAIDTIGKMQRQLTVREVSLRSDRRALERLVKERSQQLAAIRSRLGERRALLKGQRSRIRKLVAERVKSRKVTPGTAVEPQPSSTVEPQPGSTVEPQSDPDDDSGAGQGQWWPLIRSTAASRGVDAGGMYRLMMIESGGSATACGPGGYVGLYQYHPSTWKGSWNPYRGSPITDGAAQIKATALALQLGYGPRWWPSSYPWAFGGV